MLKHLLAALSIITLLSGCEMTKRAAVKKIDKVARERPEVLAEEARKHNPCIQTIVSVDSSERKKWLDSIAGSETFLPFEIEYEVSKCNDSTHLSKVSNGKESPVSNNKTKVVSKAPANCKYVLEAQKAHYEKQIAALKNAPPIKETAKVKDTGDDKVHAAIIKDLENNNKANRLWKSIFIGSTIAFFIICIILGWLLSKKKL